VKNYIYAGNRLIAEYQPVTGQYYYFMSDQINSTRIVTNGSGNVEYSEAYGPYGGIQKTWDTTYNPKQKFSGKEREGYADIDYFGARYYNNTQHRFLSVDPVINKEKALTNPQYWNLYAYCGNNPITYLDPDGQDFYGTAYRELMVMEQHVSRERAMDMAWKNAQRYTVTLIGFYYGFKYIAAYEAANELNSNKKTADDLMKSSAPGRKTMGRTFQFERSGGYDQAEKDFNALQPERVIKYDDGTRVGQLKDGSKVIIRQISSDKRPTLEIQKGKNKIKFRYEKN
jgi:RHS repeat-associated protein